MPPDTGSLPDQPPSARALDDERQRTAADYDALPYPSFPYPYLHPGRLAALAALHGLAPAAVETSRVLELGCAAGGNLIALAAQYPQANFIGIDLSARQIDDGRRRIAQLGLANIELRQGDLEHVQFDAEAFDTILCHGVFSWVPPAVQDAIVRIVSHCLAPAGVAVLSYNVLPGWHLRSVVRDICLLHAGREGTPIERAARARAGLAATAAALRDRGPYASLVRDEAKRLAESPSAYLVGEFLAENNIALRFDDFAARVAARGLRYLCEGTLESSEPEYFAPTLADHARAQAGDDAIALQCQLDLLSGRRFRRSLLVRASQAPRAKPGLEHARAMPMHITGAIQAVPGTTLADATDFKDAKGRAFSLKDGQVAAAFVHLAARFPSSVPLAELLAVARASGPARPGVAARLERAVLRLVGTGRATLSTTPLAAGSATASHPAVWPLARVEAASPQPWVTGRQHAGIAPPPVVRWLMPQLDGRRSRADLIELLRAAHASGALPADGNADAPPVEPLLDSALQFMARNALLLA